MADPAKIDLNTVKRGDTYVIDFYYQDTSGSTDISAITIDAQARKEFDGALWFDLNPEVIDAAAGHFQIHMTNEETRSITEAPPNSFSGIFDIQFSWAGTNEVYVATIVEGAITISKDITYNAKGSLLTPTGGAGVKNPGPNQIVNVQGSVDPNSRDHSDVITAEEVTPNQYVISASFGLNWIAEAQKAAVAAMGYRDEAAVIKAATEQIKQDTQVIHDGTEQFKVDAEKAKTEAEAIAASVTGEVAKAAAHANEASGYKDQAQTAVSEAQAQVVLAKQSAGEAKGLRDQTDQFSQTAATKAGEAAASAQASAQSSSESATNKLATDQAVTDAQGYATEANQHKVAAGGSAQTATSQAMESKHWADEARKAADETYVSGGVFTPTALKEYPDYATVTRDTQWIVGFANAGDNYKFTAGPLAGKTARNLDVMFLDHPAMTLSLVPNPSGVSVVEVNGKSGTSITVKSVDVPHTDKDGGVTNVGAELVATKAVAVSAKATADNNAVSLGAQNTRLSAVEQSLPSKLEADATAVNSDKLGNQLPSYYASDANLKALTQVVDGKLGELDSAENAKKFGGNVPSYYATAAGLNSANQAITNGLNSANQAIANCLKKNAKATLTDNDGYGNANAVFNHTNGVPAIDGSSYRWTYSTDSAAAKAVFQMKSSTKAGQAVTLSHILEVTESYFKPLVNLRDKHNKEITGVDYKANVGNVALTRASQKTVIYTRETPRAYTLDVSSFKQGDEVVLYATREGVTHTVTTDEGTVYYPDGSADPSFTITGFAKVRLLKADSANWVVVSISQ